ncbi:hypothetical protein L6452_27968 [Arctium lappa]|uniref:Uncharacterized protein n=1 Tax=Arctium lappa TaxID=4217 RepID=A0ACB8ZW83_ARCLA|nr:hypothetical protein L6452_27968 [Arctium lappa]
MPFRKCNIVFRLLEVIDCCINLHNETYFGAFVEHATDEIDEPNEDNIVDDSDLVLNSDDIVNDDFHDDVVDKTNMKYDNCKRFFKSVLCIGD